MTGAAYIVAQPEVAVQMQTTGVVTGTVCARLDCTGWGGRHLYGSWLANGQSAFRSSTHDICHGDLVPFVTSVAYLEAHNERLLDGQVRGHRPPTPEVA
jgi:hypothetical protein